MKATTLEVFETIKKTVKNEADAKTLVRYWEDANESEIVRTVERKIEHLATKEDVSNLAEKLAKMESALTWKLSAFWLGQAAFFFALVKYVL